MRLQVTLSGGLTKRRLSRGEDRLSTARLFAPYVRNEGKLYILAFVGSLFRFLIPLTIPLVIKFIFDKLLQNEALSRVEKLEQLLIIALVMLVVFLLIRMPMEYVRQFFLHKANNNIIQKLRMDAFDKVHRLDARYFADNKSGEIGTRFFDDIEKVRGLMTALFANIWIEMIVLAFVVAAMFTLNVKLTLLAVLLVSFQFVLAHLLSKRFKTSTRDMMSYRSVLSGFIFEKIQGAFIAKLFSAEKRDSEELGIHLTRYEALTDRHARLNAVTLASVNVLSDVTPFIVVMVASLYVVDGSLTLGGLIAFFAYVDKMRSPVIALVQAFPAITEGSVALQRIFDFLQVPSAIKEKDAPVELVSFRDAIEFRNVSFSYNGKDDVLKGLNVTMKEGGTYAFVGESGGGKSTILQLLMRMYDAGSGEVLIDGVNIKDYSIASLRNHMGIVTQDNFLYSSSIKANIKIAKLDASDEEVVAAAKKAFAHDFIMELEHGYDTQIGERGIKLSGGQKQRISLARVFLKDPSLIILDEATSALDNESEKLVQASINQYGRGKTVIMIAHRLSTVLGADTIFVVRNGRIIESGSHDELLKKNGYYKELFARQNPEEGIRQRKVMTATY